VIELYIKKYDKIVQILGVYYDAIINRRTKNGAVLSSLKR
jgi:hypothetical protein